MDSQHAVDEVEEAPAPEVPDRTREELLEEELEATRRALVDAEARRLIAERQAMQVEAQYFLRWQSLISRVSDHDKIPDLKVS